MIPYSFTCGAASESKSGCQRVLAKDNFTQLQGVPMCKVTYAHSIFSYFLSHSLFVSVFLPTRISLTIPSSHPSSSLPSNFSSPPTHTHTYTYTQACYPIFCKDPNFRGLRIDRNYPQNWKNQKPSTLTTLFNGEAKEEEEGPTEEFPEGTCIYA